MRGALVRSAPAAGGGPITVAWLTADTPPLHLGQILLHWLPSDTGGWHVTAYLGLHNTEVHLATWTNANSHWPTLIRPTLHEVRGLCSALAVATAALNLSNQLAEP